MIISQESHSKKLNVNRWENHKVSSIFENKRYKSILAIICATGWSMAYPLIKVGYGLFRIASDDLGGKLLFAGIRFFFAGLFVNKQVIPRYPFFPHGNELAVFILIL